MFRVAICDDDTAFAEELNMYVTRFLTSKNANFVTNIFETGEELLVNIEEFGAYDVIFLDIELSRINGIEVARAFRTKYPDMMLVYVSAYSEYYKAAFDVQPFQFLDKPVDMPTVYGIMERVLERVLNRNEVITFAFKKVFYNVPLRDVMYLESDNRFINIICRDGAYGTYDKLDDFEERICAMKGARFYRVQQSYLVNVAYVSTYDEGTVTMMDGRRITVIRSRRKEFRRLFLDSIESERLA